MLDLKDFYYLPKSTKIGVSSSKTGVILLGNISFILVRPIK